MWGKFGVATDFAVDQIWNKIYERYIMQTEIDQALNRQIAADYKKLTANNTSTNK